MGHNENVNMRRTWQEFPQVGSGKLYAALRPSGFISISGFTHERMGSPDSYLLLFDRVSAPTTPASQSLGHPSSGRRGVIGLKAARLGVDRNAYRVSQKKSGSNKNRTIFVRPLCKEFGIAVERTVVFQNCEIDRDGVLILDLNDTRVIPQRRRIVNFL